MAFVQVQFFSKALDVASTVNVILPEPNQGIGMGSSKGKNPPKVLYLLHGYSDDHSIWMRRTSVERYAARHNLAIIMPAVNHSFYTNEKQGEKYWDYVSEELPRTMHQFFRLSDKPEETFVAGLSMGGYGALKMALNHPERFGAAASFSGCVDMANMVHSAASMRKNVKRIFGSKPLHGTEHDMLYLLEKHAKLERKPRLYISCGTEDFLYDQHEKIVPIVQELGWDLTHYEKPGATHEWGFWDEEIEKFIEFIDPAAEEK